MGKQPRCSSTRGLSRLVILTIRTQSHAKLLSAYQQVAVYCFSHTASDGEGIRIVSARKATPKERKQYAEGLG